jgi:hypothetical protein
MKNGSIKYFTIVVSLLVLSSCQVLKQNKKQENYFSGSIEYDVAVIPHDLTTQDFKSKKDLLGTKMILTIYPNGDLQRVYKGSTNFGYQASYIQLDENLVIEKFISKDSIIQRDASQENMVKISDVRVSNTEPITILDLPCKTTAVGVQETDVIDKKRLYLTLYCSYNESLKLDKKKYSDVHEDLWSYFMNKNDGALFLKYELDYATYKVVYTATRIAPQEYPSDDENLIKLYSPER